MNVDSVHVRPSIAMEEPSIEQCAWSSSCVSLQGLPCLPRQDESRAVILLMLGHDLEGALSYMRCIVLRSP